MPYLPPHRAQCPCHICWCGKPILINLFGKLHHIHETSSQYVWRWQLLNPEHPSAPCVRAQHRRTNLLKQWTAAVVAANQPCAPTKHGGLLKMFKALFRLSSHQKQLFRYVWKTYPQKSTHNHYNSSTHFKTVTNKSLSSTYKISNESIQMYNSFNQLSHLYPSSLTKVISQRFYWFKSNSQASQHKIN